MSSNKRYYFLQLPEDFFQSKRIKKLRKLAGGDTFTIIYLKMQLKAMNNNGILCYEEIETDIAEEIAIDIDEDTDNVRVTMDYLERCGLLEIKENGDCYLPYAEINVGSITASTIRSRKCRDNKSVAMQHGCNAIATNCNGDIDIDKDKDIDKDIEVIDTTNVVSCTKQLHKKEEPCVIELILNDGTSHKVTTADYEKYCSLYPAVDVMQELRNMCGWCDSNPTKRKTKNGIKGFITRWLSREQNNGGFYNKGYRNQSSQVDGLQAMKGSE